jgi:hypothetical protein
MGNLVSAVDELLALDAHALPAAALGEQIAEVRRQINRLEAGYYSLLETFDRTGGAGADRGSTAAWVRAELKLSPNIASRDVHLARDLADVLVATRGAMGDGDLSPAHAQVIASLKDIISADALAAAEPHVVDYAKRSTPKELRKIVEHVAHSYRPDKVTRSEEEDYAHRRFDASTTIHGMGVGSYTLHAAGQETLMTAIHALSKPIKGDDRSPTQRRADALVTIAEIAMRSGELPVTGGVKPHVTVIATLPTMTGQDGARAADYAFGATTGTEWARRFGCDAEVARVIFGPGGSILDAGRSTRTFTAAQVRAIVARDRHCVWPGCDAPPGWCECHHRTHWANNGPSAVGNGALLCGRHHDRVHANGHEIVASASGPYLVNPVPHSDPQWTGHRHRAGP